MSSVFRQKVIKTLISEIELLTGAQFEQMGYIMMTVVHSANWASRGTTVEGAPRGYTVDTSAAGSTLVAEMSSESDYFHGKLAKPSRDLSHVIKLHPDVKQIWLLASREASAGETTKCANLATQFKAKHLSVDGVEILDARRIAEYIFDHLESERFIEGLVSYLPSVGRLADENALSHRIPVFSNYLTRPDEERAVAGKLIANQYVTIKGISGIGKSALAANVAKILRSEFELVIWCDARDLKELAQLSDLEVLRCGTHHNIIGLLRRSKCLLILDDAEIPFNQFSAMDLGASKVILTCQTSADPAAIEVKDLDQGSARTLLESGLPSCPEYIFQRVLRSVGGYPLLLVALNVVAQEEGWNSVEACCIDAISALEDDRHNKVCQRILARHRASLAAELEFVKWCDTPRIDAELAAICVSSRAVTNLQKRAFLTASAAGDARVHDVVYKSIQAIISVPAVRDAAFQNKLDTYIQAECKQDRMSFRRIAHLHGPLFQRLLRTRPCPSFIYAVALARANDTRVDVFGDPVSAAQKVADYEQWSSREVEIRAIIESIEAIHSLMLSNLGKEAARPSLARNITALKLLRDSKAATGEMLRDIRHHYAKMLERLELLGDAEVEFRTILSEYPAFAAGRLQLARILARTKRENEATDECEKILKQYDTDQSSVSIVIMLEALRQLASMPSGRQIQLHEPLIMTSLARAREVDSSLAFRLVAAVALKIWFTVPDLVQRMFDSIEWRDLIPASDSERFDWAQAHKLAAKTLDNGDPRRQEFLKTALDTYDGIKNPKDFNRVQHAEALILIGSYSEANARLEEVSEGNREIFWLQRKAQALLGLKQGVAALEAINKAIEGLKEQKNKSAFLADRYRIRMYLSDLHAREDLKAAIDNLPTGDKYRMQLEKEMAELD